MSGACSSALTPLAFTKSPQRRNPSSPTEKNRSEILHILEDTPADTGVFVDRLSIAYTTLIHHINILADAQLITPLTKGRNRTYVLNYEMYRLAAEAFEARYQRIMGKQNRD